MNEDERILRHHHLFGSHSHEGGGTGRHAQEIARHLAVVPEQLINLQAGIDIATQRADGHVDRLILFLIQDIFHVVGGDTPTTDFAR